MTSHARSSAARDAAGASPGLALAALLLAPLGSRAALLVEHGVLALPDLRGALADAGVSLVALALCALAAGVSRWVPPLLGVAWVGLHTANLETVRALGSLAQAADLPFLASPTFVLGSALALSSPLLFASLLLATPALLWRSLPRAANGAAARAGLAGAAALAAVAAWPYSDAAPAWRQTDVLTHNAVALARSGSARASGFADATAAMRDLVPGLAADLSGAPRVPLPGGRVNVLLVVLESVSGLYVESLAAHHGREAFAPMPRLDALARANLRYPTFVSHQRKTNRGLYALLCGELPNLVDGAPKMTAYPDRGGRACLPRVLRDAGYRTVYLQAAPLAFMAKDRFMPRAGFDEVHGLEVFHEAYARNVWGVDDRAFFEQALPRVEALAAGEAPWFLTMLTVGTHHPFIVPDDYRPELGHRLRRALAHLDSAFAEFLGALEARGLLDDTLVVITSDESLGLRGPTDAVTQALTQGWGFLVVRLPEPRALEIEEPFAQMDLALSILDYVGLGERGPHFFGRSVFRRYDASRYLFFANSNLRIAGALDPDGRVLLCLRDFARCRALAPAGGRAFAPRPVEVAWRPERDDVVQELARRSFAPSPSRARRDYPLVVDSRFAIEGGGARVIHGGQYVDLQPGEWLEVELEVEAHGKGVLELDHVLEGDQPRALHVARVELADGQTLRTHYTYAPGAAVGAIQCKSLARVPGPGGFELRFAAARMTVHGAGDPPAPGVAVQEQSISPAAAR